MALATSPLEGPSSADDVSLMACLAGYSWRYQINEFSSHYHTVALDLRGCGESDAPDRLEEYSLETLMTSETPSMNWVGHTRCILVGHDWGGMLAWHFALERPDMVQLLIVMNAPHPASWLGMPDRCSFEKTISAAALRTFGSRSILWHERGHQEQSQQTDGVPAGGLTAPLSYFRSLLSNTLYKHQEVGVP
ncbi:epoxide hydrolase [Pimephales promelas]|nr:epoxide hydrolase [Pimephales promelas]